MWIELVVSINLIGSDQIFDPSLSVVSCDWFQLREGQLRDQWECSSDHNIPVKSDPSGASGYYGDFIVLPLELRGMTSSE